jgi:hypothetical protein
MKLEAGKFYKTRDGRCVKIEKIEGIRATGKIEALPGVWSWHTDDGSVFYDGRQSLIDIASEWPRAYAIPIELKPDSESEPKPLATTPEPDYWEKLRHQVAAAIYANNPEYVSGAITRADALIEELRKKK